ncbi:CGNR zinc finger domain-containing protein [Streptomyces sp. NPDC055815]
MAGRARPHRGARPARRRRRPQEQGPPRYPRHRRGDPRVSARRPSAARREADRPGVLDADSLADLRAFRDELQTLVARGSGAGQEEEGGGGAVPVLHTVTAALQLGEDGIVRREPRGTGWRRLAALVVAAAFEGQRADTRRRLKTCRDPRCKAAFYDRSRNNSGVWHDVKTCGNTANLRAYRARRRATDRA